MRKILAITLLLLSVSASGVTCAQRVAAALRKGDAITELAHRLAIGSKQLKFLLESPDLADRTQSLLVARYLIDERGADLISELYWRAQGSTKYSPQASVILRFREWVSHFHFWSPFYRDRQNMFSDSVGALGENLPGPLLQSFNTICSNVEQPTFLRGLRFLKRSLNARIAVFAAENVDRFRNELPVYLQTKQTWLSRGSAPVRSAIRAHHLENALANEAADFFGSVDYIPADPERLKKMLDKHHAELREQCPLLVEAFKNIFLEFQYDSTPAEFEDFQKFLERRFERLLAGERQKLLVEWKRRQPIERKPVAPAMGEAAQVASSDSDADIDASGLDEALDAKVEETNHAADTAYSKPEPLKPAYRAHSGTRPTHARRPPGEELSASEKTEQDTDWLVVLSQRAKKELQILNRTPALRKQVAKALELLAKNPRHPGLETHPHFTSSFRTRTKVWRSRINNDGGGHRIHWIYGDEAGSIQVLEFVSHGEGE